MEARKAIAAAPQAPSITGKKVWEFFGDVKQEFKSIAWTPKDELHSYTKIVVGAMFIFGMLIYVIDLCIQGSLNLLGLIIKLFGG